MDVEGSSAATPPRPSTIPPPGSPDLKALLSLAVATLVIAALFVARDVFIPLILAVMLSFVLSPLVTAFERIHLPRAPSVLVAVAITFGIVALAALLLARQASSLAVEAPRYASTLEHKFERLELLATSRVSAISSLFRLRRELPPAAISSSPASPLSPAVPAPPPALAATPQDAAALAAASTAAQGKPVRVEVARTETSPMTVVRTIVEPVLAPVETTVIVLVIAIFILLEREELRDRLIRLAGSDDLHRTTAAMDDAGERLSRYFLSQLAVNGTFGLVIGVGLWALGLPSPPLWGVLAGLLRFVPYIGSIIALVPPVRRTDDRLRRRTAALWALHGARAGVGDRGGGVLDVDVGTDRPDPLDALDVMPSGGRSSRVVAAVSRCAAR